MSPNTIAQQKSFALNSDSILPEQIRRFPSIRFMGSKYRLLPWIHETLSQYEFETVLDAFSGSGAVSYLLKAMGKSVTTNDQLNFCTQISKAIIENSTVRLKPDDLALLLKFDRHSKHFIERTFSGIFFTPTDLRFLDKVSFNIKKINSGEKRAIAQYALSRACMKKQPRGVFTISGDLSKYDDGRRDLRLSVEELFIEQVSAINDAIFDNNRRNMALKGTISSISNTNYDLIYLDPPYIPKSDDNCYIKRYHFIEGLSQYWDGLEILYDTKVRKIPKIHTPFSHRKHATSAFENLFAQFSKGIIALSYSSNALPDLNSLTSILSKFKRDVRVYEKEHRYHFGTHNKVRRSAATEYLIIGV